MGEKLRDVLIGSLVGLGAFAFSKLVLDPYIIASPFFWGKAKPSTIVTLVGNSIAVVWLITMPKLRWYVAGYFLGTIPAKLDLAMEIYKTRA